MIAEDGQYGPETEARLQKTPADGFAKGATCTSSTTDAGTPPPPKDAGAGDASGGGHKDAGSGSGGGSGDAGSGPDMDAAGGGGPMTGGEDAGGSSSGGDAAAPNSAQYDMNSGCACREAPKRGNGAGAWFLAIGLLLVLAGRSRPR
jgi:hypothetical protein